VYPGSRSEQHLCSEFLCLGVSPASQFGSGNSSWKPKIVLNPRTGTRLPSGRVGFYHQNIKSLRGAIHGRGQSRRPCAHDYQITNPASLYRLIETKTIGDLAICGITQNRFSVTDHHRRLIDRNVEVIEEALNVGVALQIDVCIRVPVAGEEL